MTIYMMIIYDVIYDEICQGVTQGGIPKNQESGKILMQTDFFSAELD